MIAVQATSERSQLEISIAVDGGERWPEATVFRNNIAR